MLFDSSSLSLRTDQRTVLRTGMRAAVISVSTSRVTSVCCGAPTLVLLVQLRPQSSCSLLLRLNHRPRISAAAFLLFCCFPAVQLAPPTTTTATSFYSFCLIYAPKCVKLLTLQLIQTRRRFRSACLHFNSEAVKLTFTEPLVTRRGRGIGEFLSHREDQKTLHKQTSTQTTQSPQELLRV